MTTTWHAASQSHTHRAWWVHWLRGYGINPDQVYAVTRTKRLIIVWRYSLPLRLAFWSRFLGIGPEVARTWPVVKRRKDR